MELSKLFDKLTLILSGIATALVFIFFFKESGDFAKSLVAALYVLLFLWITIAMIKWIWGAFR